MKAFIYNLRSPTHFSFTETAALPTEKQLKNGEILVRIHAAALNPVDYKKPALMPLASLLLGGTIAGQDYSGVVVASRSPAFAPGDCVFGTAEGGCLAQYLAAPASTAAAKPPTLTHAQAASLVTVAQTCLQAFAGGGHSSPVLPGQRVLVVGASGGCGLAGVQVARSLVGPQGTVVGVCSAASFPLLASLSCTDALCDYSAGAPALLASLTPHAPFDIIYDTVSSWEPADTLGGTPYPAALAPLLRPATGCHVAINGSAGQWVGAVLGWQASRYRLLMQQPSGGCMRRTAELALAGALQAVVDSTHAFTEVGCQGAYARLRSRRAKGKVVVLVVGEEEEGGGQGQQGQQVQPAAAGGAGGV